MASEPNKERLRVREASGRSSAPLSSVGLPHDVVAQSAARLRVLALLYAFIFFMAGFFPALFSSVHRGHVFGQLITWVPGAIAIAVALVVAATVGSGRVPLTVAMNVALAFEVLGSYGIAAAEFVDLNAASASGFFGLSWVSVWTLLFTMVIPTAPRRAVMAALASVSAVPVVVAVVMSINPAIRPTVGDFVFALVFPYLLVVIMAYVGARVVYALGTEVTRARELGSYHLVERLGEGGMGEVWRASHRMLAWPAAIKLIRPSIAGDARAGVSEAARKRFEREAQAIASLRSPHTIDLFDFGMAEDGAFYYVMELLEGLDADALVRRHGPVPAERVVHILRQMCHSLSEAESRGLVHRDIKPANVFLCRYGEDYDFVKVLDFGMVKPTEDATATGAIQLTGDNVIQSTPAFMAPEQALGGPMIDGRVDIYAMGCVAYWLLTGELVFTGDSAVGMLVHHANTAPAAPSTRTELPIPAALDQLVLKCLAKNPADRPQTARQLSQLLAAIDLASPWTEERARIWWERHQPMRVARAQPDATSLIAQP